MVNDAATTPTLVDIVNYEGRMLKIEPEFSETELNELLTNETKHILEKDKTSEATLSEGCVGAEKRLNDLISPEIDKKDIREAILTGVKVAQAIYSLPEHGEHVTQTYECRARTAYILARAYFILVAYTPLRDDLASSLPERQYHRDAAYTFLERALEKYAEAVKWISTADEISKYSSEAARILNTKLVIDAKEQAREGRLHIINPANPAKDTYTPPIQAAPPKTREVTFSVQVVARPIVNTAAPVTAF